MLCQLSLAQTTIEYFLPGYNKQDLSSYQIQSSSNRKVSVFIFVVGHECAESWPCLQFD